MTAWSQLGLRPTRAVEFGISAVDIDDDGDDDLLGPAAGRCEVWLNRGDGSFWLASTVGDDLNGSATAGSIFVADIAGGRALDLLFFAGRALEIHEGNGDGTFVKRQSMTSQPEARGLPVALTFGDFSYMGQLSLFAGMLANDVESLDAPTLFELCVLGFDPASAATPQSFFATPTGSHSTPAYAASIANGLDLNLNVQSAMAADLRGSVKTPIGVRRQFSSIHLLSLLEGL